MKDFRVTFSAILEQCGIAASNQILGLIRRTITYKDKQVIIPMYIVIGRIWNIAYKHGGHIVRRIKMIPELRDFSYKKLLIRMWFDNTRD